MEGIKTLGAILDKYFWFWELFGLVQGSLLLIIIGVCFAALCLDIAQKTVGKKP